MPRAVASPSLGGLLGILIGCGDGQLAFVDTPAPALARQHGVGDMGAGTFVILDNIGNASESRAERHLVNEMARTARLIHSYGSNPGVTTRIGGSVQPLAGGRTPVSFGTEGRVEEYDAQGRLTWSIQGNAGYVFRAQRIRSLYAPGVGRHGKRGTSLLPIRSHREAP